MPTLTATNPAHAVVELVWTGLTAPQVILWQCFPDRGCFDTLKPNTGHYEVDPAAIGTDGYQVCEPAQPVDICTPTVWIDVT
jgi:hypothetical protein